ncbi:hypothetical protein PQX77_003331 [Marasmius sp. AFHP31]|nr:hypothetical protein PQX77_003331 [Marasmius sp. AFHP31]
MLLGVFFNAILWGIMTVQTMMYYQVYKKDSMFLRCFVLYLVLTETANSALYMAMMHGLLIAQFGSEEATTIFPKVLAADPLLAVLVSSPVQMFAAYRIHVLGEGIWISSIVSLLALVSLGGGMWTAQTAMTVGSFQHKAELYPPILMWLLASAVVNVTTTSTFYRSLAKQKIGYRWASQKPIRFVRWAVQTGLFTATFAILDVVCFLSLTNTAIISIWHFVIPELYTISLLSNLNARTGRNHLAGGDVENVMFVTATPSQLEFRTHPWLGGFGWGSTYQTNPDMSFTGSGQYETGVHDRFDRALSSTQPQLNDPPEHSE